MQHVGLIIEVDVNKYVTCYACYTGRLRLTLSTRTNVYKA